MSVFYKGPCVKERVSVGLVNPKNAGNVASVLRAVGCFNASSVFYTGQRYNHAKDFHADTKAMHKIIPTVSVENLRHVRPQGARVVVVELVENAIPLPDYTHCENSFYIFGPEDGSVPADVLSWADDVIYIPTKGCLNLAATVNVVLYDRLSKGEFERGNALIKGSRDTNNRAKVTGK
ncbi:RNA methyltransferase [Aestuariibacter sp. A3R04]|nr:RNA methyltransferase [Aestuariibacter sp. A3R04]